MQEGHRDKAIETTAAFFGALTAAAAALYLLQPLEVWIALGAGAGLMTMIVIVLGTRSPLQKAIFVLVIASVLGVLLGTVIASRPAGSEVIAHRLNDVLSGLAHQRDRAYLKLSKARDPLDQARIARELKRSFFSANKVVRRLKLNGGARDSAAIGERLAALGRAFGGVALAVSNPHGSQRHLNRCLARVRLAEEDLIHAERSLRGSGYEIAILLPSQ